MDVKQISSVVNDALKQTSGEIALLEEDLSNIVEVGKSLDDFLQTAPKGVVDNYCGALVNRIGKTWYDDDKYELSTPSVVMDNWEYGSIMQKIHVKRGEAQDNESWQLQDGASYDQDIFTKVDVNVKFFNDLKTYEVPISIPMIQVKESFTSVDEMQKFINMIKVMVEDVIVAAFDDLVMRTINNFAAEIYHTRIGNTTPSTITTLQAVNLLKMYNDTFSASLTTTNALYDKDFIRFAVSVINEYPTRLSRKSVLFNVDGEERYTPKKRLHVVLLESFKTKADIYLQSDTFHENYTKLVESESVPYWQGTGTDYALSSIAKVKVKTASGDSVQIDQLIGVMFDRWALGVTRKNSRVRSHTNERAEFYNYWYKEDANYFNDLSENGVIFFIA